MESTNNNSALSFKDRIIKRSDYLRQKIAENGPKEILLHAHQCPGDTCVATIAVESLAQQYPNKYKIGIVGIGVDGIFKNNPHVARVGTSVDPIQLDQPHVHRSNQLPVNFSMSMCDNLGNRLGIKLMPITNKPVFYLTGLERAERLFEEPYCLINAGWKDDGETKWYARYQEVVDQVKALYPYLKIVQVGESHHHHPLLKGVVDMIGAWNGRARPLIVAANNAEFGIGPISFMLHVFAGLERPYVCLGTGYEPPSWAWYPGVRYITRYGTLPCCRLGGCWKRKWSECVALKNPDTPACLDIPPEEVVAGINNYADGGLVAKGVKPTQRGLLAIATAYLGDYERLKPYSLPALEKYANRIGAELIYLDKRAYPNHPMMFEKFQISNLLERFHRVLWIDADCLVSDNCPDLFKIVPQDAIGAYNEYANHSSELIEKEYKLGYDDLGMPNLASKSYYNVGVFLVSRCHKELFTQPPEKCTTVWQEQTILNIRMRGYSVRELPVEFNQMANKGPGYIRHFAGMPLPFRLEKFKQALAPAKPVIKPLPECKFLGESIRNADGSALTRDCGLG